MAQNATQQERPRVLIVDDEAVICNILKDFLELEEFYVQTANSGETALRKFQHDAFDVLLTDLKMPGMDGIELIHQVQGLGTDTLPLIMTGFGTVDTAISAMKNGAFDYILKPFRPDEVVRVLRKALKKQAMERENLALKEIVGFYELAEVLSGSASIDEQLRSIMQLVQDNFGADSVSILLENPECPGQYDPYSRNGNNGFCTHVPRLLEHFVLGEPVIAHGKDAENWIQNTKPVSSFMSVPLKIRGAPIGILNAFCTRSYARFTEGQRKGMVMLASRAANAIENSRMYKRLQDTFTQTMEGFARALEAKDPYTHGHSDRVAMFARLVASTMGLSKDDVDRMAHGGLMHDIGKIGIRTSDLNKHEKLTSDEYVMFQSHPEQGRRIIEGISFLSHLVPCVYSHHEAWDGSGYPQGLSETEIPLEARILAVVDTYDAMTSNRPYRKALPHDIAVLECTKCAGRQFDRQVVEAFVEAISAYMKKQQNK